MSEQISPLTNEEVPNMVGPGKQFKALYVHMPGINSSTHWHMSSQSLEGSLNWYIYMNMVPKLTSDWRTQQPTSNASKGSEMTRSRFPLLCKIDWHNTPQCSYCWNSNQNAKRVYPVHTSAKSCQLTPEGGHLSRLTSFTWAKTHSLLRFVKGKKACRCKCTQCGFTTVHCLILNLN